MSRAYVGVLDQADSLCRLLTDAIDQFHGPGPARPIFEVYRLGESSVIYRYVERAAAASVVAKFYGNKWIGGSQTGNPELRAALMHREYDNAIRLRDLGLCRYPHSVVHPLAVSEAHNYTLVEEYVLRAVLLRDMIGVQPEVPRCRPDVRLGSLYDVCRSLLPQAK